MAKPIGNQVINVNQDDKVDFKTRARYGSQAAFHLNKDASSAAQPAKKQAKYKTRKKKS